MNAKGQFSGFDFMQLVNESRTLPEIQNGAPHRIVELPPTENGENLKKNPHVEDEIPDDKITVETHYLSHSRIFVLWRPWETCARCLSNAEQTDYCCPHNDNADYRQVVDSCLRGDALIILREAFTLKDGIRCMHLEWLTIDPKFLAEQKRLEEQRRENQVYPPDIERAFGGKK